MPQKNASPDAITDGHGRAMLSVDDVAINYLGCSTRHVYRLVDSGRMPRPIKLGSLIRWPRAVIEQWIADGCPNVRNLSKGGRS
ncbi:MAG: helix-turn-helix domain-containing protein [Planctomycetaceae bacterium]|nr:helix-turn-helix domain-containing protein [Planctomycetaceae bacterium]